MRERIIRPGVGNESRRKRSEKGEVLLERDDRENSEEVAFERRPDEQESVTRKFEVRPRPRDCRTAGTGAHRTAERWPMKLERQADPREASRNHVPVHFPPGETDLTGPTRNETGALRSCLETPGAGHAWTLVLRRPEPGAGRTWVTGCVQVHR